MKKVLALLLALVMTLSLVACGGYDASEDEGSGDAAQTDTLVVLSSGAFQGDWDPTNNTILANKHLEWVVFDTLFHKDADGNFVSGLAEDWKWLDDGYTLQIKVREGVTFHDGSDFNAEDVVASVKYLTRPESALASNYGSEFDGEVVDTYTANIWPTDKSPKGNVLDLLYAHAMMSADDIANGTLSTTMNGCGPYKFVKYENETCYLEAFENYWDADNAAKMKYCEYKYVPESSTRLAALQTGEAQLIERVDIEQVPQIDADDGVDYTKVFVDEQKYMIFKCTQGVMNEELVRKAISYAIDREGIVNDILGGYAVLADSYLSHVNPNYSPAEGMPTYNIEKAKELLAEAGYPNGEGLPTIKYITSVGLYPKTKEYAEYIVSTLESIGLKVDLVVEEVAAWETDLYLEDSCLMCDTGWMNVGGDTNFIIASHYGSNGIPGRCNFSHYDEVDAAMAKETAATDPAERKAIIQDELWPLLVETNTNMPLFDSVLIYGYSKDLQGLEVLPSSNISFNKLSVG